MTLDALMRERRQENQNQGGNQQGGNHQGGGYNQGGHHDPRDRGGGGGGGGWHNHGHSNNRGRHNNEYGNKPARPKMDKYQIAMQQAAAGNLLKQYPFYKHLHPFYEFYPLRLHTM